jgi:hypothetical protein
MTLFVFYYVAENGIVRKWQLGNPYEVKGVDPSIAAQIKPCPTSLLQLPAQLGRKPVHASNLAISICGHSLLSSQLIP